MSTDIKRRFQEGFFDEAEEHIMTLANRVLAIEGGDTSPEELDAIFRAAHSMKGGAAALGLRELAEATHALESLLDGVRAGRLALSSAMIEAILHVSDVLAAMLVAYRAGEEIDSDAVSRIEQLIEPFAEPVAKSDGADDDAAAFGVFDPPELDAAPSASTVRYSAAVEKPSASTTIRVDLRKIDELINLVGELVIAQSMLTESSADLDEATNPKMLGAIEKIGRHTRDLREHVMGVRMVPIGTIFNRFPRMVRDLAGALGKSVRFETVGGDAELDKSLTERLVDPLTHLIRNALDHGIEAPHEREAAGKPAEGTITLRAASEGGHILIQVSDDGAGLNRASILRRAHERDIPISDDAPDAEVWELIFAPGFSTAESVTEVSGRGVGMDVVRRNVLALQGGIEIESSPGQGTVVTVRVPLTLAILDGLTVRVRDELFVVPLTSIVESVPLENAERRRINGLGATMYFRAQWLPVIDLARLFGVPGNSGHEGVAVVFEAGGKTAALLVDSIEALHQVVIKSLEANFRPVSGIAGATVMGTGRVALILDLSALARLRAA